MLIRNAFDILSGASERIAYLSSEYVDKSGTPIQPKIVQQLIEVTSLYDIIMSFVTLNDDGDAIGRVIGENDENLNILLFQLKKAARITSFPEIPNPINSITTNIPSIATELPIGVLGDLFYHNGSRWTVLPKGADGETIVATAGGLQYQSVVGNGIPSGGSSGQFLIKNSNTSYDAVWASMTLSRVTDVTASAAEVNKLSGALWSTAESNTLVGINTGQSIQAQLNNKLTSSLQDGYFNVGNGSGVATAVPPSGDVTFSNLGVFAINAGVIDNDDISASAAIARSKLALGTANRMVVNNGTGVMADAAGITSARALISDANGIPTHSSVTATTLGFVDATSSIQTQLNQRLIVNLSSPAQGALIFFNGTDWTNLALGTNGQVLQSNGTTVAWGSATANGLPSGGATNEYLRKINGTNYNTEWHELVMADVTDVSATAAELSALNGWTGSASTLNFVNNVTSDIQNQLDNKLTTGLAYGAIFAGNGAGIAYQVSPGNPDQVLTMVGGQPQWQDPTPPGNVSGPVSSTDRAIATWNGIAGDALYNTAVIIDASNNITGVTTLSSGQISVLNQASIRLYETGSTNYLGLRASGTMSADYTITFPSAAPSSNTYLKYDGANYVWATAGGGGSSLQQRDEATNPYTVVDGDDGYIIYLTGTDPVVIMDNAVSTNIEVTFVHAGTGTVTFTDDGGASTLNTIGGEDTIESINGAATWVKNDATNWWGWGALGSGGGGGGGTVTSVSGTSNRITSTGGTTPVIDIAGTYVGQASITTLGTIATGVWQGTVVGTGYGGTGLSSIGTANQLIRVNAGATAIEYFTPTFISANETITLSGDVSGSGTTAITTAIGADKVLDTMLRNSSALSVIGRSANSSGDPADIAGTAGQILRVSGSTLAFGSIDLASSAAVGSSILSVANGGTGTSTGSWLLTGTSTLAGTTTITSGVANRLTFNGTWTASANDQYHVDFSGSLTARSTVSDNLYGYKITPTLVAAANSQTLSALYVNPTFTVGAFTGLLTRAATLNGVTVVNGNLNGAGNPTLLVNSDTTGSSSVIARFINPSVTNGWMQIASTGTGTFSLLQNSGYGITVSGTGGITINSPTNQLIFTQATNSTTISFGQQGTNPTVARYFSVFNTSASASTAFTPTSGTAGLYQIINTGNSVFQPSSGTATWATLAINPTINQTGTASGVVYGIDYNPTINSITGPHYGFLVRSGLSGFGLSSPTALVDISGSTTSRSSLRIQSGVAPTTPNDGDIWQDGTDIKIRIGGATKSFVLV